MLDTLYINIAEVDLFNYFPGSAVLRIFLTLGMYLLQDDVDAKIVVAGHSTTCSQKIHNQLVQNDFNSLIKSAISDASSQYYFIR